MTRTAIRNTGWLALAAAIAAPAAAQAPTLVMLDQLQRGRWELRVRGEDAAPRQMCLTSGRPLIQLRHPDLRCGTLVVTDTPDEVTVQYTCKGRGYGRTTIRRENDALVQVDSQGIADGLPFAFTAEARRIGSCRG